MTSHDEEQNRWLFLNPLLTSGIYPSLSPWSFQRPYQQSPNGLLYPSQSPPALADPQPRAMWTLTTTQSHPSLPMARREQPVVGYRAWHTHHRQRLGMERELVLKATSTDYIWQADRNQASCTSNYSTHSHLIPDPWCGCGFWVLATLDELEKYLKIDTSMLVGAVMGWGRVIQHGKVGWRAQYARPIALLDLKLGRKNASLAQQISRIYRLPIFERAALEMVVQEHDGLLPASTQESQR